MISVLCRPKSDDIKCTFIPGYHITNNFRYLVVIMQGKIEISGANNWLTFNILGGAHANYVNFTLH